MTITVFPGKDLCDLYCIAQVLNIIWANSGLEEHLDVLTEKHFLYALFFSPELYQQNNTFQIHEHSAFTLNSILVTLQISEG